MKARKTNVQQSADERMTHYMDCAGKCYSRAKDGIIEAIAYVVLVYRAVESNSNAAAKIDNEIAIRNSKINGHNKHQLDDRARAQKLAAGTLADEDLDKHEKIRLSALAALSDDEWKVKHIKVAIEARTDANAGSRIVKHLLNLDSRADAPNASRYTTAVLWVYDNCPTAKGAADIVTAIKNAGGLDKVIDLQRLTRKKSVEDDVLTQAAAVDTKTSTRSKKGSTSKSRLSSKQALLKAASLTSFKMNLNAQLNDLFLLVGRYRDGKVEVVKAAPLSDDKLDSVVDLLGTVSPVQQRTVSDSEIDHRRAEQHEPAQARVAA